MAINDHSGGAASLCIVLQFRRRKTESVVAASLWLILILCGGLPLAWLFAQLAINPRVIAEAVPDGFRWRLIARTFGYDALAATLATCVAVPVGVAVGFGRSWRTRWLWALLPVPLLLPSLVITYGWKQVYARFGYDPMPQGFADVARCVVALASWSWPVPAMIVAVAARRIDASLLLHARLDGALARVALRLLAGPVALGWLAAMLLALQEFAVFEPTGISVIATEVRAVFETGASLDGSWSGSWSMRAPETTQDERVAAALAVMLPGLMLTAVVAAAGWRLARSLADGVDWHGDAPDGVRASPSLGIGANLLAVVLVGAPIVAMALSLRTRFEPARIANDYWPQLAGSMTLALGAATVAVVVVAIASAVRAPRAALWLALASFLVGGQWAAIALIHVFNRPWLAWAYDGALMPVIAYVGRFAWVGLAAAAVTWSPGARPMRELAATDGATAWQAWRHVVLPLAWPLLLGAVVLTGTLSLTEVPATTLLQPAETLVPMLMQFAHQINYDAMIEASLMVTLVVVIAGVGVAGLVRLAARWRR